MKLSKVQDRVKRILLNSENARNNDRVLIANMWHQDVKLKGKQLTHITGQELMLMFTEGELSNVESIRRVRQKLQQENPELRGNNHKQRQAMQPEIVGQIKEIDVTTQTNLFNGTTND